MTFKFRLFSLFLTHPIPRQDLCPESWSVIKFIKMFLSFIFISLFHTQTGTYAVPESMEYGGGDLSQ